MCSLESFLGLVLATITTNLAANAVPAANALVNLNPRIFSFTKSAVAMAVVALITRPWLLISSSKVSLMAQMSTDSLPGRCSSMRLTTCSAGCMPQQENLNSEHCAALLQQLLSHSAFKETAAPIIGSPLKPQMPS